MEANSKKPHATVNIEVKINPIERKKTIQIKGEFYTATRKNEDGSFDFVIPGFDFYFSSASAITKERMHQIGSGLVMAYFHSLVSESQKFRLQNLVIELSRKGFKSPKDAFDKKLLIDRKPVNTNLSNQSPLPTEFEDSQIEEIKFDTIEALV